MVLTVSGSENLGEQKAYLEMLIKTRKGTLPGNRDYGLDCEFLDAPQPEAETRFAMDVFTAAQSWLEDAVVKDTKYGAADDGIINAAVEIESGDEYA